MSAEHKAFPVIAPLVMRHTQDAAFYWSQRDASLASTSLGFERYAHFDRQLTAHLFGLKAAGASGRDHALAALRRWKKSGEAFVYAWLCFQCRDVAVQDSVFAIVESRADELLRGVISALAFLPPAEAAPLLSRFADAGAGAIPNTVALRAAAIIGPAAASQVATSLEQMLASQNRHVRASACRYLGMANHAGQSGMLHGLLDDSAREVRAEAAIALSGLGAAERPAEVLAACMLEECVAHAGLTGLARRQASRRLTRWTRHLAMLPGIDLSGLLAALPVEIALTLVLYRGEMAYSEFVLEQFGVPAATPYAIFVFETLTGIDLEAGGAFLRQPGEDGEEACVIVDRDVVRRLLLSRPDLRGTREPVVLGRLWDAAVAASLLREGSQAVRLLAATRLRSLQRQLDFNVRAPAVRQAQLLRTLTQ